MLKIPEMHRFILRGILLVWGLIAASMAIVAAFVFLFRHNLLLGEIVVYGVAFSVLGGYMGFVKYKDKQWRIRNLKEDEKFKERFGLKRVG